MARQGRRSKGEGAVYQRASDGLWVGMLDLGMIGGKRRRKAVYGQTEREVLDKLRKLRAAREHGLDLLAPTQTVGQWLDIWLSEVKGFDGTRPAALTLYRGLSERYVKPVFGSVRLDRLTPAHVQRLMSVTRSAQTARGRPPSTSTLRHVYKLIRNALGDAYRMELVTRNVATQVKPPPLSRDRRPDLTIEDAKRLLAVLAGERLQSLYVLALMTGLRRGELLGLLWDDVDMESRQLHVRRALQRTGGSLQFVEPKTESSVRTVVLPRLAVRSLVSTASGRTLSGSRWARHGRTMGWSSLLRLGPR